MKGYLWNSDGFSDPTKHLTINEAGREHHLDFIVILETGPSNFLSPYLKHLARRLDFSWFCLPPQGRLGGNF
jgi:hypothetical protein